MLPKPSCIRLSKNALDKLLPNRVERGVRLLRLDYLRCQGSPGLHNRTDADKDGISITRQRLIELAKSSLGRFRRNYPADSAKNLPGISIGGSDLFLPSRRESRCRRSSSASPGPFAADPACRRRSATPPDFPSRY